MSNRERMLVNAAGTPFRFLLHIGAGKTGTSSIQETLRSQQGKLKAQATWYLGLMLEHAPVRVYPWQRAGGSQEFLALPAGEAMAQVLDVLQRSIPVIRTDGFRQAIWSNEWFFDHGTETMIGAMKELSGADVDLQVVAYVRRHDAWARSAYVQWGLKHKTYQGPLQSFEHWIKLHPPLFAKRLRPWRSAFGDALSVRNLDAVGDAVSDFLAVAGIDPTDLEKLRVNETPCGEELSVRARFNGLFREKVPVNRFERVLGRGIRFDESVEDWLARMMPDETGLQELAAAAANDRQELNQLLAAGGQPPMESPPVKAAGIKVSTDRLLAAMCQIVLQQAIKLHQMEERMDMNAGPMARMEESDSVSTKPVPDKPVFVLSTGRSGSTLVQRVLNCHPDLVVWGEHFGFLEGLATAYAQMQSPQQTLYQGNPGSAALLPTLRDPAAELEWANPWDVEEFKAQSRHFIEGYFAGKLRAGQRWGFKEIRYNAFPSLRMLRDFYPEGRFLFVKRDPVEVTRSKVFSFIKEEKWSALADAGKVARIEQLLKEVLDHYSLYDTFLQRNPGKGLVVNYEELVANPQESIVRMLAFLGLEKDCFDWSLSEQVMGSVLARTKRDDEVVGMIRHVASSVCQACA